MTLREKRVLFSTLASELVLWINRRKDWSYGEVECAFDEGAVHRQRQVKVGIDRLVARDAVHVSSSRHYDGLALDLLIYVNGVYVTSGEHPIWKEIDAKAQALHPKLSLGTELHDANHLSLGEGDQE